MTNEELVLSIQQGHEEHIEVLWNQVYKFISWQAGTYVERFPNHFMQLKGDMINESYIRLLDAIEGYRPGDEEKENSFLSYFGYHLKSGFAKVVFGGVTMRAKNEPLNQAISIDAPVKSLDEAGITIADTLVDYSAEACMNHIGDIDFWKDVNRILKKLIHRLSNPQGRQILLFMLDYDASFIETINVLYFDNSFSINKHRKQYRKLKRVFDTSTSEISKYMNYTDMRDVMIKSGLYDYISYHNVGVKSFMESGYTSIVERTVLKHEEIESRNTDILQLLRCN